MSDQNQEQYNQNQHQKTTAANDTHESTSKTDKPIGVGENEENHTSGDHIQYQREGKNSQQVQGGEDDTKVHTDNNGGNSAD